MIPTTFFPQGCIAIGVNPCESNYFQQINDLQSRCDFLQKENAQLKQMVYDLVEAEKNNKHDKIEQKRKERRNPQFIESKYFCTYTSCKKVYGSDLALNLHIKNKHNGGTKTYRQTVARQIVLAEQKGDPMPYVSINFPPNYLKEFRKKFFQGF